MQHNPEQAAGYPVVSPATLTTTFYLWQGSSDQAKIIHYHSCSLEIDSVLNQLRLGWLKLNELEEL